jgi:hypothetical protein
MIRWSFAVLILILTAGCATAPKPERQGVHLMAQMKAASGGARLDAVTTFHENGTRVRDGSVNGTYEAWGDFTKMRFTNVETFAGVTSTGGFDGQANWSLGPDGKARIDTRPERLPGARLGAYLTIQGYFWPDRFPATFTYQGRREVDGKSYDVVTVTPDQSLPVDLWLDPVTHRLQRLSGGNGKTSFTGVINSYQMIDGIWVMSTGVQTQGTHTETQNVGTYRFEPVPEARFAPPN